ncbi:MAG: hypothetical protein ACJ72N_07565 [Labedaea sp.]|jgi:hypothetical protein
MRDLQPHELLDAIKREFNIKSDAELARQLGFSGPQISKVRARVIPCTDILILRIHETFGVPVPEIRELADKADAEAPEEEPEGAQ